MRMMLIPVVDEIVKCQPEIYPAVVADDIQFLFAGTDRTVRKAAISVSRNALDLMESSHIPVSLPKLVVLASTCLVVMAYLPSSFVLAVDLICYNSISIKFKSI